jgi:hypothetical protein
MLIQRQIGRTAVARESAYLRCAGILLLCVIFATESSGADIRSKGGAPTGQEETPSTFYDSALYRDIEPRLRRLEQTSNRVRVEVMGQSAEGRDLYLATLSAPETLGRLGHYSALRQLMIRDPEKAQKRLHALGDFKVPVFINASIHGNEYPGTDAALRLIETLALGNDEIESSEIDAVLGSTIILVNVVANPDGRVRGERENGNGFDLNRDFITQSQPETRAAVRVIGEWNPMIFLDLHGFMTPMLIEPTTPPHNPNYEYDLYLEWAFHQAERMEAELASRMGIPSEIPFRDFADGWDDWAPLFAPMYAMFHGSYAHTLEVPFEDKRGVDAHFWAIWGALLFVAENRVSMLEDQIEIFRRGFLDLSQVPIPDDLLAHSPYDQYNDQTVVDFPAAHIIPAHAPEQADPHAAAKLIDFLIANDIQVEQATQPFRTAGESHASGSYVVRMDQPKRGLANTILADGLDVSVDPGLTLFDIAAWDHTRLWGVTRTVIEDALTAKSHGVTKAQPVRGRVHGSRSGAYSFRSEGSNAIQAINHLLASGQVLHRTVAPFGESGKSFAVGTIVMDADQGGAVSMANDLAHTFGLEVFAIDSVPAGAVPVLRPRVAAATQGDVVFVLRELGFMAESVSRAELEAGILDGERFDVLVNTSTPWFLLSNGARDSVRALVDDGGHYIGIGRVGSRFAVDAGFMDVTMVRGDLYASGIIAVDYERDDPIAAGRGPGFALAVEPLWFADLPLGSRITASIAQGAFFRAGYWPGWPTSGAAGRPVVIHAARGSGHVTLFGIEPVFRAHPKDTYDLLANALLQDP